MLCVFEEREAVDDSLKDRKTRASRDNSIDKKRKRNSSLAEKVHIELAHCISNYYKSPSSFQ